MTGNIAFARERLGRTSVAPTRGALNAVCIVAFACVFTAFPIVTHLWSAPLAITACGLTTLVVANYLPSILPAVLVFSYLFQNTIVSLVSPWLADPADFGPIRGYSFLATAVAWLVTSLFYWGRRGRFDARLRSLMTISTVAIALTGLYFVYGVATSGSAAIIYLRNIAGPLFLFQTFAVTAQRCEVSFSGPIRIIAALLVVSGYFELFFRSEWLTLLNGRTYWTLNSGNLFNSGALVKEMHETGKVYLDIEDLFRTDLFNSNFFKGLDISVLRLSGPNYHPISFGYALAFMVVYSLVRRGRLYFWLALPLLVVASAKGSILLIVATMAGLAASRIWPSRALLGGFVVALGALAVFGIVNGLREGDYHVAGFFGGIAGFIGNPLGHGLGSGGNLTTDFTTLDWQKAQALGQSATAVESAVGVLLYQMGIAAFALLATYVYIAVTAWRRFLAERSRACAAITFALGMILMNGIFQEEALFAPLALGLIAGYAGIVMGTATRRIDLE